MKIFTIMSNNKIYKVQAKDCDTAMKAVEDACVKDAGDFFTVSYVNNGVNQIIAVRAHSEQEAKQKFTDYMKKKGRQVEFVGVTRGKEDKPGMPIIDTCIKAKDKDIDAQYVAVLAEEIVSLCRRNKIEQAKNVLKKLNTVLS